MHAIYMRSTKSPGTSHAGLERYRAKYNTASRFEVFSQVHEDEEFDEDYEKDSFCIGDDDDSHFETTAEGKKLIQGCCDLMRSNAIV